MAAASSNRHLGDLLVHTDTSTWELRRAGYQPFTIVRSILDGRQSLIRIHLDQLPPDDLQARLMCLRMPMDSGTYSINFTRALIARHQKRHIALVESLACRTIQHDVGTLNAKYREIFNSYCLAYRSAEDVVADEIAKKPFPLSLPTPLNRKGKPVPEVTIICKPDAAYFDTAAPSIVPVDYIIIAPFSSVVQKMKESNMREAEENAIVLKWDIVKGTAEKIIDFMYNREPMQMDSDEEAAAMYRIADMYNIETVQVQCGPMAKRHMLTLCSPEQLLSSEAFDRQLAGKETLASKARYFEETVQQVNAFYTEYLVKILPRLPVAAAVSISDYPDQSEAHVSISD